MKNTQSKKLITKRDGIIILLIFIAAAVSFFIMKNGKTAVVTVDGEVIRTIPMDYVMEYGRHETMEILENVFLDITYGEIKVKSSDCPNQICVRTGRISKKGEKIVCLPKKLVIEIE